MDEKAYIPAPPASVNFGRADYNDPRIEIAGPGEPVFLIRAKDPLAAETIRHWANLRARGHTGDPKAQAIVFSALTQASAIEAWQRNRSLTPADLPYDVSGMVGPGGAQPGVELTRASRPGCECAACESARRFENENTCPIEIQVGGVTTENLKVDEMNFVSTGLDMPAPDLERSDPPRLRFADSVTGRVDPREGIFFRGPRKPNLKAPARHLVEVLISRDGAVLGVVLRANATTLANQIRSERYFEAAWEVDAQVTMADEITGAMVVYREADRPPLAEPEPVATLQDPVQWAKQLIEQLPEDHDGRNSWLMEWGHITTTMRGTTRTGPR